MYDHIDFLTLRCYQDFITSSDFCLPSFCAELRSKRLAILCFCQDFCSVPLIRTPRTTKKSTKPYLFWLSFNFQCIQIDSITRGVWNMWAMLYSDNDICICVLKCTCFCCSDSLWWCNCDSLSCPLCLRSTCAISMEMISWLKIQFSINRNWDCTKYYNLIISI